MDLAPLWGRVYRDFDPRTGGTPTPNHRLTFICPACGPPFVVSVVVGPVADQLSRVWKATPAEPDGATWPDRLTLEPSIGNETAGHGPRRPHCALHGNVVNGVVMYA